MIRYKYSVLDESNSIVNGELDAFNEHDAKEVLISENKKVISIKPDIFSKGYLMGTGPKKISSQEIALFCKQLSIITKSGISIIKGLIMIKGQSNNKIIGQLCENIYTRIEKGFSISSAFRNSGYRLPLLLINMIEIGELSGNLDEIFKKMSDYYEKDANTKKKIISALIYPIILACVSVGVIILFTFFILPGLVTVIEETGGKLPFITSAMLAGSKFVTKNIGYIAAGVVVLIIIYKRYIPNGVKLKIKNYIFLKMPLLAGVTKDFITARFTRTMGILIKTGLPMLTILETLENVVGNDNVSHGIYLAREKVSKGEDLTTSLEQIGFFDSMVTNIISIGEEAGSLDTSLIDLAEYYDEKFDSGVAKIISLLEPAFTLVMGGVIGTIVLSAMLPMFNMIGSFSNINGG